jgi:hypothetical protein
MKNARVVFVAGCLFGVMVWPALVTAQESGLQVTPDRNQVLISKDVGEERWAIVRNQDGTVSGNVFFPEGGPPLFVWCEPTEDSQDDPITFSCFGADACPAAPCDEAEWEFIAEVELPASFFEPPAAGPTPTPGPTATPIPIGTPTPNGSATPDDTPTPDETPDGVE